MVGYLHLYMFYIDKELQVCNCIGQKEMLPVLFSNNVRLSESGRCRVAALVLDVERVKGDIFMTSILLYRYFY